VAYKSHMKKEIWKDITGYSGDYQISNTGKVRSLKRKGIIILSPRLDDDGYYCIGLRNSNQQKFKKVHRLVAETFIDNPENKKCVDHINNIRTDNRTENLRWVTIRENNQNRKHNKEGKTTSKYSGVCYKKANSNYVATIQTNGKNKHIGSFKTEEEAAEAYDKALIELGLAPVNNIKKDI
jgi:hypothetical protein